MGNNIPVFFIVDAIKFPDLVHSIKPEPDNEIPQASAAHDTFWDFIAHMPETANTMMWLLSDRALPRSFRMMEGFGVNTFRFVNEEGKGRFVKFHWKPVLGVHSLVWDETQKIAGKDPDFNRRDLWEAIEMGDYPEFELGVQMIEEEDEHNFDFDILDPTKIWPEELVPVVIIGKLTLNRNPDNFFAETEQVAFCPGNVVPGIDFSNDPLLQGRLFSYLDTQLIRLSGPNFKEIPINRPIVPVHNNQRDGYHRTTINKGKVHYFPSSLEGGFPKPAPEDEGAYVHYMEKVDGRKVRQRSEKFNDHFSQAALFWHSMSEAEKDHIISAFHFEIGNVKSEEVRMKLVDLFSNVDKEMARKIAEGVGVPPPSGGKEWDSSVTSPAVSMANTVKDTIRSRRVAVLAMDGVNEEELMQVRDSLAEKGAYFYILSKNRGMLNGSGGGSVEVDKNFVTTGSIVYDAVYVPGGQSSIDALMKQGYAINFINEAFKHCKPIGASGEGVDLLNEAALKGVNLAEGSMVYDRGVVTTRSSDMGEFTQGLFDAIAEHRHWDREKETVPA